MYKRLIFAQTRIGTALLALSAILIHFVAPGNAQEQIAKILAWNIESGGADVDTILYQLKNDLPKCDVYGFCEVGSADVAKIKEAFPNYESFAGSQGGNDRLQLLWKKDMFNARFQSEMREVDGEKMPAGANRPPLYVVLQLKDDPTKGFVAMMNHLTRGKEANRDLQAKLLQKAARNLRVPCVCMGDLNMDYDFKERKGTDAVEIIQRGKVWTWVKPKELIDSNWSDSKGRGKDEYPDSLLDLVFVAGPMNGMEITCEVLVREGDFPETEKTSDHRPILIDITSR